MGLRSLLLITLLTAAGADAQTATLPASIHTVDLPEWAPSPSTQVQPFELDTAAGKVRIWGRRDEAPRVFGDEFLPALFERTCVFEDLDLTAGTIEWIFTGPRGGITVSITGSGVRVAQRFYDSFGYNHFEGDKPVVNRHPERTWHETSCQYAGKLIAVTVRLDHRLGLSVDLNGQAALHQHCLLDMSRHQLRIIGDQASHRGVIRDPEPAATTVRLHPARRHQQMIGFGGITTPTAYEQLSPKGKRKWWEILCEYNLRIQREYPNGTRLNQKMDNWDRLADATPHYYGDNFPNGEISDFAYQRTLRQLDGLVFFEFWDLPPWATKPWHDANGKAHQDTPDLNTYAQTIVRYCRIAQEQTAAPPDVVGIQNEKHQPAELWHGMTLTLRRQLDEAGFDNVQIHMSDSGSLQNGIQRLRAFQASSEVWAEIDYAATHMYDYQKHFTNPDAFDPLLIEWQDLAKGKPFLSTELCINWPPYQTDGYRLALVMGQLYHKNLVLADAAAICYCWTLLNVVQPTYGQTRSLMVLDRENGFVPAPSSRQLRMFGAFSRRIARGMVRIDADSSHPDLLASAFVSDDAGQTVILLNRSSVPQKVRVEAPGIVFDSLEVVSPYHPNSVHPAPLHDGRNKTMVEVDAGAIVTLSTVPLGELPTEFKVY